MTKFLSQRERERKSTPVQSLGYKRKKEGEKTYLFNTLFWGEREYELTHDDK
tara:strand:+ start:469 stop:624 length:156 start_codon:yes stop_codon:yes gene_type:complete